MRDLKSSFFHENQNYKKLRTYKDILENPLEENFEGV